MADVVCAGLLCVDMIPCLPTVPGGLSDYFAPGKCSIIGPLRFSPGGAALNTGIALHLLGVSCNIVAKIGDDEMGRIAQKILADFGCENHLKIDPTRATAYTIALAVPGFDRIFLTDLAANHSFSADDLDDALFEGAKIFHFGYPQMMAGMYQNGGKEMRRVLEKAKAHGLAISLDTALPDPNHENGKIDWERYLNEIVPLADFFLPSLEELIFMMDPKRYQALKQKNQDILSLLSPDDVAAYGEKMQQAFDCAISAIKCGSMGYYLKTGSRQRLQPLAHLFHLEAWANREYFSPIYQMPNLKSTGAAGDASIAGLLAAILAGEPPHGALDAAVGAGAMCVKGYSVEEMVPLKTQKQLMGKVFQKAPLAYAGNCWHWNASLQMLEK